MPVGFDVPELSSGGVLHCLLFGGTAKWGTWQGSHRQPMLGVYAHLSEHLDGHTDPGVTWMLVLVVGRTEMPTPQPSAPVNMSPCTAEGTLLMGLGKNLEMGTLP